MADEYGPWITYNGGKCLVAQDALVQAVILENEVVDWPQASVLETRPASAIQWGHWPIIAYRVKREPVVETVRCAATAVCDGYNGEWHCYSGHNATGCNVTPGFLVFETRDGKPDMTTLRWEDA